MTAVAVGPVERVDDIPPELGPRQNDERVVTHEGRPPERNPIELNPGLLWLSKLGKTVVQRMRHEKTMSSRTRARVR